MLKQICYKERGSHHWYLSKAVLILKLEMEVGLYRLFYFVIKTFGMGNNLYFFLNTWEVTWTKFYILVILSILMDFPMLFLANELIFVFLWFHNMPES